MPNRITDRNERSYSLNSSNSQTSKKQRESNPSDQTGDPNSLSELFTGDKLNTGHSSHRAERFDNQKFLNIDQLEAYFKANLEEIELNLDDLIQLENNLVSGDKRVNESREYLPNIRSPSNSEHSGQSVLSNAQPSTVYRSCPSLSKPSSQEHQCFKQKSSKSKFLAKRNRLRMNKEVLISNGSAAGATGKWIGQTSSSVGSSSSSSPMLSPCSSASDECATSSVEMRLSNLGSLSTYSLCSSSPNVSDEHDDRKLFDEQNTKMFSKRDSDRPDDFYNDDEMGGTFVEMTGKKSNDKQYELFDITRSMPSLDLIESINSSSLPRLLKQFDKQYSQPKLDDSFYQDYFESSNQNNKTVNRPEANDSIADSSLSNSQKLIMTRFGFIKTCPAAKNLVLHNSSGCLNEDEQCAKSLTSKDSSTAVHSVGPLGSRPSEINRKMSLSSMDFGGAKPLIQLPKPINQRSLSALTINCDTSRVNKPFTCAACSSTLCKCKAKANSLLALNHQPSMRPKIPKKPLLEVSTVLLLKFSDYTLFGRTVLVENLNFESNFECR